MLHGCGGGGGGGGGHALDSSENEEGLKCTEWPRSHDERAAKKRGLASATEEYLGKHGVLTSGGCVETAELN